MKILKGYVFRMYPNVFQKKLIEKSFGCSRFIYNYYLNDKQREYKEKGKSKTAYDQIKALPELCKEKPFLKEVDSCILRNSIFNLDNAYQKFYKEHIGYPNYKRKGIHENYKTNNIKSTYKRKEYNSIKIDLTERTIKLPKLGKVKVRGYRNKKEIGNIKSAVIKKEAGRYYISILVEEEIEVPKIVPTSIVGIDLGIKDTIITSNGYKLKIPSISKELKRLKGYQKALSRSERKSKNRYKIKMIIQRIYQKIKNIRKYFIHQITNKIVKEDDIIVLEDLDIKGMYENHKVAKELTHIPLSEIIEKLRYKSKYEGKYLIQIDRYYPSSQICSRCNYQNKEIKDLKIRKWECPRCHIVHDRDYNATENILFEGLKKYMKIKTKSEQVAK